MVHFLNKSVVSVGMLFVVGRLTSVQGCSTNEEITECLEKNRQCLQNLECGPCIEGFVEFPVSGCVAISSLTLEMFIEEFAPSYKENRMLPSPQVQAQRLQRLIDAAMFINEFRQNLTASGGQVEEEFELGLTPFSADSVEEYQQRSGFRSDLEPGAFAEMLPEPETTVKFRGQLPERIDWRELGAVTSVKDQGRCGCCWAVSMVGAVEGAAAANALANGYEYLQNLSWQQFISCNKQNKGCEGGDIVIALGYAWLNKFDGLTRDNEYPYSDFKGDTTQQCSLNSKPLAVTVSEPKIVFQFDTPIDFETRVLLMKEALQVAPVSMVIRSSCKTMSNYKKGILTDDGDCACSLLSLCVDHAVLMVGYDDTTSPPSWILKNSWSSKWGEDGYFRISQEEKGTWGLFAVMSYAVQAQLAQNVTVQVEDDYKEPKKPWVWILVGLGSLAGLICLCGLVYCVMSMIKNKRNEKE